MKTNIESDNIESAKNFLVGRLESKKTEIEEFDKIDEKSYNEKMESLKSDFALKDLSTHKIHKMNSLNRECSVDNSLCESFYIELYKRDLREVTEFVYLSNKIAKEQSVSPEDKKRVQKLCKDLIKKEEGTDRAYAEYAYKNKQFGPILDLMKVRRAELQSGLDFHVKSLSIYRKYEDMAFAEIYGESTHTDGGVATKRTIKEPKGPKQLGD